MSRHLRCLGLTFAEFDANRGVLVQADVQDDSRIQSIVAAVPYQSAANFLPTLARDHQFWTGSPQGQHALRAIARVRALQSVRKSRLDAEGIEKADVDIVSNRVWKKWVSSLSQGERGLLSIYRAGAVRSQSRAQRNPRDGYDPCAFCGAPHASFRHLWADCPHFRGARNDAAQQCPVPELVSPAFWSQAPRCTSKSGWVVTDVHPNADYRAHFAVASSRVALVIMRQIAVSAFPCQV